MAFFCSRFVLELMKTLLKVETLILKTEDYRFTMLKRGRLQTISWKIMIIIM